MNIELILMKEEDKSLLVRLMELYNYEFTRYDDEDINEYGYYGYSHIDDYWNEDGRFPYLIRVDGKIAGFVLICPHCRYISGENTRCIGEFFVMIKYRGMGVGKYAATQVFRKHPGLWEVCYMKNNTPAATFWKKVITAYTDDYKRCGSESDEMQGYIFNNSAQYRETDTLTQNHSTHNIYRD